MPSSGYARYGRPNTLATSVPCDVCGADCVIERAVECSRPHTRGRARWDRASCPSGSTSWHQMAQRLGYERDATLSPSLRTLLQGDIEELLAQRASTPEAGS